MDHRGNYELDDFSDSFARNILIPYERLRRNAESGTDLKYSEEIQDLVNEIEDHYELWSEGRITNIHPTPMKQADIGKESFKVHNDQVWKRLNYALKNDITGRKDLEELLERPYNESWTSRKKREIREKIYSIF